MRSPGPKLRQFIGALLVVDNPHVETMVKFVCHKTQTNIFAFTTEKVLCGVSYLHIKVQSKGISVENLLREMCLGIFHARKGLHVIKLAGLDAISLIDTLTLVDQSLMKGLR